VASIGISVLALTGQIQTWTEQLPDGWDPTQESLKGLLVGQLLIGMLGALSITAEYTTGSIATTLAIVPRRPTLLGAKAMSVSVVTVATSIVTVAGSFFASQAVIGASGLAAADISEPDVERALIGAVLYLTLIGLIGLAFGTLTRSSAGALGTVVALTLLAPALTPALPGAVGAAIAQYWPTTAGQAVYAVVGSSASLPPWLGLGVMALFTLYLTIASHVVFRTRDA
jgi:ABC-type transport system involved in multi-copper enzyme maturation permease subunit